MRWPIRMQLLVPTLAVAFLAVLLAAGGVAYWRAVEAREQQQENLRRVALTLADATFPLTQPVLDQAAGLSGAEFVLLDTGGLLQTSTVEINDEELALLREMAGASDQEQPDPDFLVSVGGSSYLIERVPVPRRRATVRPGWLIVLYPEDRWSAAIRQAVIPALLAGAIVAAAVVLVSVVLAHRFVRPIRELGTKAARIAGGDFEGVAVPARDDEIRDLAVSISQMGEKLSQYEKEVRRSERLRTLGQLGAGLAHQLRNSATGAAMAIEIHQRRCPDQADSESLEVALRQLRLMESYLQRFLTLGRSGPAPHEAVALDALVGEVVELVGPLCRHANIEVCISKCPDPPVVPGRPEALRQLLVNLVLNAIEAAERSDGVPPRVVVDLERAGAGRAELRVSDTGPGPSESTRDEMFEPFVTDKPEGTGLGLAVARQIVQSHQGTIRWQRRDGMTTFIVELPIHQP